MPLDISWDEFEARLIQAGWSPDAAHRERLANEFGDTGDCDGDLGPADVPPALAPPRAIR
jgi:hypothetical protein